MFACVFVDRLITTHIHYILGSVLIVGVVLGWNGLLMFLWCGHSLHVHD